MPIRFYGGFDEIFFAYSCQSVYRGHAFCGVVPVLIYGSFYLGNILVNGLEG